VAALLETVTAAGTGLSTVVQVLVAVLPLPPLSLLQPLSLPPQPAMASVMTSRAVMDANVRIVLSLNLKLSADAVPHRINTR
jgi:hypothetical protein